MPTRPAPAFVRATSISPLHIQVIRFSILGVVGGGRDIGWHKLQTGTPHTQTIAKVHASELTNLVNVVVSVSLDVGVNYGNHLVRSVQVDSSKTQNAPLTFLPLLAILSSMSSGEGNFPESHVKYLPTPREREREGGRERGRERRRSWLRSNGWTAYLLPSVCSMSSQRLSYGIS